MTEAEFENLDNRISEARRIKGDIDRYTRLLNKVKTQNYYFYICSSLSISDGSDEELDEELGIREFLIESLENKIKELQEEYNSL